jgi:SNF2 family DNA or RNA helicase
MESDDVAIDVCPDQPGRMAIMPPGGLTLKQEVLKVPGARYDQANKRFTCPLSWASCVTLRGIFGDRLVIGEGLRRWARQQYDSRIGPALDLRTAMDAPGDPDLYGFQRAGVQFLTFAGHALLGDDMGLGKTVQAIRTLMMITRRGGNPFPALVIAPNSMVLTWQREFQQWWPGLTIVAVPGGTPAVKRRQMIMTPAHAHVISYETARSHSRLAKYGQFRIKRCIFCDPTLADIPINSPARCEYCRKELNRPWATVIIDEAHRIKDPTTKTARVCWAIREGSATHNIEPARYALALTGTPIGNAPQDLWPALRFIDPHEFPTKQAYIDRFCYATFNGYGTEIIGLNPDPKIRQEFYKIIDPVFIRRPKSAVLSELPPKIYSTRLIQMSSKQEAAYDAMEEDMIAHLDEGLVVSTSTLAKLVRLLQFSSAFATLEPSADPEEPPQVRLADPSNKIDALMEILSDMGDEPVVVFALHKQLIDLAVKRLDKTNIKYGLITGDQKAVDREVSIRDFQNGELRVMLCTIAAGGVGITLTRAGTAIFLQRSWSMIDNRQAEDRIHRIGSENHDQIEIIDIVSPGTIEERQREVLVSKADRLEEVVRDRTFMLRLLGRSA